MAEIFVIGDKKGQSFWIENCPQCGNDEHLLPVEMNGGDLFLVKCCDCHQIVGLCTIKRSEVVYIAWGAQDDVLKAWDLEQLNKKLVKIRYINNYSSGQIR